MTTRNQTIEQRITDHDTALVRLESATGQNLSELEAIKASTEEMKKKLGENSTQMTEMLKVLQLLTNREENANDDLVVNNGGQRNETYQSNNRLTKMEFPKFLGTNVEGWLCHVEHFYSIDATTDDEKVRMAVEHIDDIALLWHQSFVKSRGGSIDGISWLEYKTFIANRFATVIGPDAMGALASIKQTGSLQELCDEFDLALTKVTICDEYAVSLFLRAVNPEIGDPLRLLTLNNIPEAYMKAKIQKDILNMGQLSGNNRTYRPYVGGYNNRSNGMQSIGYKSSAANLPLLPAPLNKTKPMYTRKLSTKEIAEKKG